MTYNVFMQRLTAWVLVSGLVAGFLAGAKPAAAAVLFRTGEIMDARNVTAGETGWSDTVKAKNLDEIEFRVFVENLGNTESPDVNVRVGFALDPGSTLKNKIFVGVWSAPQAVGTVSIDVDSEAAQKLIYVPGKAVKYGGGCDGCVVSDSIATAYGAQIGTVEPNEKIEVRFRAQVTNRQTAVLAAAANSVTPTPTPNPGNGDSGGTGGAAVAGTSPRTGFMDPIWARTIIWVGLGLAGIKLRQIAGRMGTIKA